MGPTQRLHAAHDARAAPEGDHRQRIPPTRREQLAQLLVGGGVEHGVGRARGGARAQTHEVGVAPAGGVKDTVGMVVADVLCTEDLTEPSSVREGMDEGSIFTCSSATGGAGVAARPTVSRRKSSA